MNTETLHLAIGHLSQYPPMQKIIAQVPMLESGTKKSVYFDLLESIVSQQLSVKAAATIFGRVLDLFPDRYPHPEFVQQLSVEQLRAVGLSNQKAQYFHNVAAHFKAHDLENCNWDTLSDQEIIDTLTQIKGVGVWTVQMVMMFTLHRTDIFPVDDLGIQHGMIRLFELEERGKDLKTKMLVIAEDWKPYRTIAARYLWRWKDSVVM
jgi:DNA-3-methyladenine glycosylase II